MTQLIKINNNQMVDARELHKFLEVKSRFNDWISNRIEKFSFTQGIDYTLLKNEYNDIADLQVTVDMAKELCMLERNEKGKQARLYFIECEKRLKKPMTTLEFMKYSVDLLIEQERKVNRLETRIDNMNGDTGYRTLVAYAREKNIEMPLGKAKELGKKLRKRCTEDGYPIGKVPDERWGQINSYPVNLIEKYVSKSDT